MIRNILVEGIDCAGKSTLVKELSNRLGWDDRFLGHRDTTQYSRYLREYAWLERTVIERGHISEIIYSELWGRPRPFTLQELRTLNSVLRSSALIVFADPDLRVAEERYRERRGVYQPTRVTELRRAGVMFRRWFRMNHFGDRLITYASHDWEELEAVVSQAQSRLQALDDPDRP